MLIVDKVSFSYGSHQVLNKASLSLQKGEIGTLLGSSGTGKSTLFKLITGLYPLGTGAIEINGLPLPEGSQQVACMMQESLLLPWRDALGNITLLTELGQTTQNYSIVKEEALALLADLGMGHCSHLFPDQLSGGMQQRILLARALIQKRPFLLLDEPFGSLDLILREQMYGLLKAIQKKYGTTILMVTHDFRDAVSLSDRIFVLSRGAIHQHWTLSDATRHSPRLLDEMRMALV